MPFPPPSAALPAIIVIGAAQLAGGAGSATLTLTLVAATPVLTVEASVGRTILGSNVPAQVVVTRAGAGIDLSKKLVVAYTLFR